MQPRYNKFFCERPKTSYHQPQQPQDQVIDSKVLAAALEQKVQEEVEKLGQKLLERLTNREEELMEQDFLVEETQNEEPRNEQPRNEQLRNEQPRNEIADEPSNETETGVSRF